VSGFSAEWLSLREPHDAAARAADVVAPLRRPASSADPRAALTRAGAESRRNRRVLATPAAGPAVRKVLDLGAGSGANLRWLAPRLGGAQEWHLVDRDAALLTAVEPELDRWAKECGVELETRGADAGASGGAFAELCARGATFECRVRRARLDLAADLARLEIPASALVTSSALLDLVSDEWLRELARRCLAAAADVCFALSYDGRSLCDPSEPEDAEVLELFNHHQRGDKGFGPALGPAAPRRAADALESLGYGVTARRSDWRLAPGARDIQKTLIGGWLEACLELAPHRRAALEAWHRRRIAHVDAGRSTLLVGHVDIVGSLA
jgi:hypothetical protein